MEARRRDDHPPRPVGDDQRHRRPHAHLRVKDNAGNWSPGSTTSITVVLPPDKTAPTDKTSIPTDWRTGDYTVTLAAEDDIDGVGVDYVEWRLDGGLIKKNQPGYMFNIRVEPGSRPGAWAPAS